MEPATEELDGGFSVGSSEAEAIQIVFAYYSRFGTLNSSAPTDNQGLSLTRWRRFLRDSSLLPFLDGADAFKSSAGAWKGDHDSAQKPSEILFRRSLESVDWERDPNADAMMDLDIFMQSLGHSMARAG